jgi:hypothetical protein
MPEMEYNPETGDLTIYDTNGAPHIVTPPKNEQGEPVFPFQVEDASGQRFQVDLPEGSEDGSLIVSNVVTINEGGGGGSNIDFQGIDPIAAAKKVSELVPVLIQRINDKLHNVTEEFPNLAFENRNRLTSITEFDPNVGGGGVYRNGRLFIGRTHFVRKSGDEDIMATIYHEYMHYLNWQRGDNYRYRMESLELGIVYQKRVPTGRQERQSESVFLDDALFLFVDAQRRILETEFLRKYPMFYEELQDEQKKEVDIFIEENNLVLDFNPVNIQSAYRIFVGEKSNAVIDEFISNFPDFYVELSDEQKRMIDTFIQENNMHPVMVDVNYDYSPSNFFWCEINAHTQTLNANDKGVFNMSDENINFYHNEIIRYTRLYNRAREFEDNNNINRNGYEQN